MPVINPASVSAIIREVSDSIIMPRFRQLGANEISEKAPGDLVTIADREAEIALGLAFQALAPGSDVIGEEAVSQQPELLEKLPASPTLWLIDPVDGTNNFVNGSPTFAVMVALLQAGVPVQSWIYQPVTDEMTVAERGSGAWYGEKRLSIPPPPDFAQMLGAAHIGRFPKDIQARLKVGLQAIHQNQPLFCAGLDYVALSRGTKHFSLYSRTLPWDHLPGTLIHQECGGYVACLDGSPYVASSINGGLLSAASSESWQELKALLLGA